MTMTTIIISHKSPLQLAGASYMEIHQAGGGINYTVEQTRKASHEELYTLFKSRMKTLLKSGTVPLKVKTRRSVSHM